MFTNKAKKETLISILISSLIIIFVFFTYFAGNSNFLRVIGGYVDDNFLYKKFYSLWIHQNDVVIIKIDDKTLNSFQKGDLGVLTFSKKIYSDFLEKIFEEYNAGVVGFDIIFSNKSINGEKDEDILRETFERYKNRIVIGSMGNSKEKPLCKYNNVQHGAVEWIIENRIRKFNIFFPNYETNNECEGTESYEGNKGGIYPLSIELYRKHLNNLKNKSKAQNKLQLLDNFIKKQISLNNNELYSRFFQNNEENIGTYGFKSYSLIDILNGESLDDNGLKIDLEGKIVLLGEAGTLLHDRHFSPVNFNKKIPGVEFHANSIVTIKDSEYLKTINIKYILIVLIITIFILYYLILKSKTYIGLLGLIILLYIHLQVGLELFSRGYIYPLFFFAYSLLIGFMIIYFYKYITIDKQKSFIKKAFSMFLSPEMVEIISNDPSQLSLKGKKGNLTIFFSDIESFTSISEKMKAEDLFNFLNEYFAAMTNILTKNKGTLDKYIGDSVMGFFNAPLEVENHEYLACKTAIEQQKTVEELNNEWEEKLFKKLIIRIGINSGLTIHGNLGSKDNRINYTVIGDNVNLASRLEGINKQYGTNIIISEETYKKVNKDFITRELDTIKVKGKSESTKIYELIGFVGDKVNKKILQNYETGINNYYKGEYLEAIFEFNKNKEDIPSKKMISRCEGIIKGTIQVVDGVYQMNIK